MPKTCKQFCKKYKKKSIKNMFFSKSLDKKSMQTKRREFLKTIHRQCKIRYCNKTCKNTLLQPGRSNYPPLHRDFTSPKHLKTLMLRVQKENKEKLFGKKDTVLNNGFYEKLGRKEVNKLKKNGAISGCVQWLSKDSSAL